MSGHSLLGQFRRGAIWTYSSAGASMLVQLGVTATTARLLDPADFGLVAMANVLLRFGSYVAQMGVGRALIQAQDIDKRDIRAAFTSSAFLGLAVAIVIFLIAPLAAAYYQAEAVIPVIRWMAVLFVVSGLGATAQALLRRNLRFRAMGLIELAAYGIGYAVPALWLAASGYGVWSLVFATIGQAAVTVGLAYGLARHELRPLFALRHHKKLLGFGSKVSAISLLEFIGSMLDTIVIGRLGTASQLGLYNRAFMLASLPTYQLNNGLAKVLFPVLASSQKDREAFNNALDVVAGIAIKVVITAGVGMAVAAPELVSLVLGSRWQSATLVFAVLSVGLAVNLLATFPGVALEALGRLRGKGTVQAAYVVALAGFLVGVYWIMGFNLLAFATALAGANFLRTIATYLLAMRAGIFGPRTLWRYLVLVLGCAALSTVAIGSTLTLARASALNVPLRTGLAVAAGVASLAVLLGRQALQFLRQARMQSRQGTS